MLRHLAQRAGLAAFLAAGTLVLTTPSPLAIAADTNGADADAEAPPPPPSGKRLSPAAQAAAILMERRRRKQQEGAEAAAAKAAAEAAATTPPPPPPPPTLPLEPCPERACRGAQDMLAAFAEVRARLKQQQKQEEQKQQEQSKDTPYLWWAEALPDSNGETPTPPCPPDTAELGNAAWTVLHSVAAYYPQQPSQQDREALRGLVHGLAHLYPCAECRSHLPAELAAADAAAPKPLLLKRAVKGSEEQLDDDATSSRPLAERWMCELHNAVSVRLGKPPYDCARVGERWRDGWRDGSCG